MTIGKWRPLHWLLAIIGLLLLALLACEAAGWPFLRVPLEKMASAKLQREVRFGDDFRLHLLGGIRLRTDRFHIGAPPWDKPVRSAPAFFDARDVYLELPYRTVLGRLEGEATPLFIRLLEVQQLDVRLLRRPDGHANWRFEALKSRQPDDKGAPPRFERLVVHQGQVALHDAVSNLDMQADIRTTEGSAGNPAGLFVQAQGRFRGQAFTGRARSPGLLPIIAPEAGSEAVALRLDARLDDPGHNDSKLHFQGRAVDLLRFQGLDGSFRANGPALASVGDILNLTLPTTAPFAMQGQVHKRGEVWDVSVTAFDVANTHLSGDFRFDRRPQPPRLSGRLRGSRLVLKDLAPSFGAASGGPHAAAGNGSHLLPQREFNIPALKRMNADIDIHLDRVDLGTARLEDLHPLQARLRLQDGVLRLDDLLARTASGELHGRLALDSRQDSPLWTAHVNWSGIHLADWLKLRDRFAHGDSGKGSDKEKDKGGRTAYLKGELAGEADLRGRGNSVADVLGSLDGSVRSWIRNGAISHLLVEAIGLDVAQALGMVVKGDEDIPLRCAAVSLKADDGVLKTEVGVADTPDSLLLLDGQVALDKEKLDLTLRARPHDVSPLSVRSPLHLEGSFANPEVSPNLKKVGVKALAATALGTLLAPLAALLPLVDTGESTAGQGCAATLEKLKQKPDVPKAMKRAVKPGADRDKAK